jgi:hypothetical protein
MAENSGFTTPTAIGASLKEIAAFGSQVSKLLAYKIGGDIRQSVEALGGNIKYAEYDDMISKDYGTIVVEGHREFTIHLPYFTSPLRDRFTIAHEIGHYILHSNLGAKKIRVPRRGRGKTEWQANWFAAGFLMPEKEFKKSYNKASDSMNADDAIEMLAAIYFVSTAAAKIRAKSLGLI